MLNSCARNSSVERATSCRFRLSGGALSKRSQEAALDAEKPVSSAEGGLSRCFRFRFRDRIGREEVREVPGVEKPPTAPVTALEAGKLELERAGDSSSQRSRRLFCCSVFVPSLKRGPSPILEVGGGYD